MKRFVFIIVIFISTLFSCDYDYAPYFEAPKPQIELQDLPAYAHFKTGTYWIYKDSASGVEDSVYVYSDTAYSYYHPGNTTVSPGNYNYYEFHAYNYSNNYNYYYKIDMGYYGNNKVPVWREKFRPGDYVGQSFLMFNSFDPSISLYAYTSSGVIRFKDYNDSMVMDTKTFYDVTHFSDSQNASENLSSSFGSINPATDYFISKNIGIVKMHVYDTVFNTINKVDYLIRYHIVQ